MTAPAPSAVLSMGGVDSFTTKNFAMTRGDTLKIEAVVKKGRAIMDITDCDLFFTIKQRYDDDDANAVARKSTGGLGGVVVTDAAAGAVRIVIPHSATVSLRSEVDVLFYDFQLVNDDSEVYTLAEGTVIVNPDVTASVA